MAKTYLTAAVLAALLYTTAAPAQTTGGEAGSAEQGRAGKLDWLAEAGLAYYDNIQKLRSGGDNDTAGVARLSGSYENESRRHAERLWVGATYNNYFDNVYSDDIVAAMAGDLTLDVVEEVFAWGFTNNYGPTVQNPLDPQTPDNRSYMNVFSTGPSLVFGAGQRTRLEADALYVRTSYDDPIEQDPDTNQVTGDIGIVRQVSPETAWSIHGSAQHVSYDDAAYDDYDIYDGYLRYDGRSGRTSLTVDVGASNLDDVEGSDTKPLLRLAFTRQLTPMTSLSLTAGSEYQDAGATFARTQDAAGAPSIGENLDVTTLAAPLLDQYVGLAVNVQGVRTNLTFGANYSDQEYQSDSDLSDQKSYGVVVGATRQLSESLSASLQGAWNHDDYQSAGQDDNLYDLAATVSWRVGAHVSLTGGYWWEKQNSNENSLDYTASVIGAWVSYSPTGAAPGFGFASGGL